MSGLVYNAERLRLRLVALPRVYKRLIWVVADLGLLSLVLLAALTVRRYGFALPDIADIRPLVLIAPLLSVLTLQHFRLYRVVTRYFAYGGDAQIAFGMAVSVVLWVLLGYVAGSSAVPRSVALIYLFAGTIAIVAARHFGGWLIGREVAPAGLSPEGRDQIPVVIVGTGPTALHLQQSLGRQGQYRVAAFLETSGECAGQFVGGVKVHRPEKLRRLIERAGVREVFLAMPHAARSESRAIVELLQQHPVSVKTVPDLQDIAAGRVSISDLKPVAVEDLLGRDAVPPDPVLMARSITGKSILVTGAGGSVGSELARLIVDLAPQRLLLLDVSEEALYRIEMELREVVSELADNRRPVLVPVLGSVLDEELVRRTLEAHAVQTIYHAAAYKHVPLVEANPFVGILNNTFGAQSMARQARLHGVERFVLISTDKAVRPTNVMGASKRMAEVALQAVAAEGGNTIFTMVRFGNVLDSSGSVVPLFRKQIARGGPVTVTHPDIIRYFMTIREAAQLVIQAGAMARGGELFLLDMGEPVRIDALARLMISLAGREVRSEVNPGGDIEIVYSGLRPGEKLYEELLVSGARSDTEHARIFRSEDPSPPAAHIRRELDSLHGALEHHDLEQVLAVLQRMVEGYNRSTSVEQAAAASEHAPARAWTPSTRTLH